MPKSNLPSCCRALQHDGDCNTCFCAHNYEPLDVVLTHGEGVYVFDEHGKRYLDCMSAYSAANHGHCHPKLVAAATAQLSRLTITSRAYSNEHLCHFAEAVCELTGYECMLPMNSGTEAVETAIKVARKWGYRKKDIHPNKAEIIVVENNFHGRSTTIVGFSSSEQYRDGFGPFAPGFKSIPYNDPDALAAAITPNTVAFLVEPVQGEGGVVIPDSGYLKECAKHCHDAGVLLICDEIQTGLGRTGKMLASEHEGVHPDCIMLGKSLGGGLYPISAFLTSRSIMEVITPGDHGSTFGGNPLACAIGMRALEILQEESFCENAQLLGKHFLRELRSLGSPLIKSARGVGLMVGLEINTDKACAHDLAVKLLNAGLLTKETNGKILRLAPPLIITREQIDEALSIIRRVLC